MTGGWAYLRDMPPPSHLQYAGARDPSGGWITDPNVFGVSYRRKTSMSPVGGGILVFNPALFANLLAAAKPQRVGCC